MRNRGGVWWLGFLVLWSWGCNAFDDPAEDEAVRDFGEPGFDGVAGANVDCSPFECSGRCPFGCGNATGAGGAIAMVPGAVSCGAVVCQDLLAPFGITSPFPTCCAEPGVCGTVTSNGCEVAVPDATCPDLIGNTFGFDTVPCCLAGMCGISSNGTGCFELGTSRDSFGPIADGFGIRIPAPRACGDESDGGTDELDAGFELDEID